MTVTTPPPSSPGRPAPLTRERGEGEVGFLTWFALLAVIILIAARLPSRIPIGERWKQAQESQEAGDANQARAEYEAFLKYPDFAPKAELALAALDLEAGDLPAAESRLRAALETYPDESELWEALGGLLLTTERGREAAAALTAALENDPGNIYARILRAQMLEDGGNLALARPEYEWARRAKPDKALYALLEARLLWRMYKPTLSRTLLAQLDARGLNLDESEEKLRREILEDLEIWPDGPPQDLPNTGPRNPDDH